MFRLFSLLIAFVAFANVASAATIFDAQSAVRGSQNTGLATSAPGNTFSFDFRSSITKASAPYDLVQMGLIFDGFGKQFGQLNVELDSAPGTTFTFLPWPGNNYQIAYTLWDPRFNDNPGDPWPAAPAYLLMPQTWHDELSDGILSGHLWVRNAAAGADRYIFSTSGAFAVPPGVTPEPAAVALVAPLAALALRRHRRNSGAGSFEGSETGARRSRTALRVHHAPVAFRVAGSLKR
jgi:hypothetical protein